MEVYYLEKIKLSFIWYYFL